jgi:hypothetical protein
LLTFDGWQSPIVRQTTLIVSTAGAQANIKPRYSFDPSSKLRMALKLRLSLHVGCLKIEPPKCGLKQRLR